MNIIYSKGKWFYDNGENVPKSKREQIRKEILRELDSELSHSGFETILKIIIKGILNFSWRGDRDEKDYH